MESTVELCVVLRPKLYLGGIVRGGLTAMDSWIMSSSDYLQKLAQGLEIVLHDSDPVVEAGMHPEPVLLPNP